MKRAPVVTVASNEDVDWTPEAEKIRPRRVEAKAGKVFVRVEECFWEDGKPLGLIAAAGDGASTEFNLMYEEMMPDVLDRFIELLTAARDKARTMGMPSRLGTHHDRNGTAAQRRAITAKSRKSQ